MFLTFHSRIPAKPQRGFKQTVLFLFSFQVHSPKRETEDFRVSHECCYKETHAKNRDTFYPQCWKQVQQLFATEFTYSIVEAL